MNRLALHFLGSFQVILDGKPVSTFRSDKVRALLAYLALEFDRPHQRESLAAIFWPDMPLQAALKNFRLSLHRLRQTLEDLENVPPFLQITRETVQFNMATCWLDVTAFSEILKEVETHPHQHIETCSTCLTKLEEAVELYRGDFLQGFYLDENLSFSEWALLKRESMHRRTLWALHHLAAYYRRRGEHGRALNFAWRQLELEPWREEAHRQVMEILAQRGERSAALAQYEVCCRILAEEFEAEPTEETTILYERIRLVTVGRHNLPGQPTAFIGREEELAEVIKLLEDPECRLLTIVGPGGIGKTRLALEAAATRIDTFLEGVHFVSLVPVESTAFLASAVADTLRLSFSENQNPQEQLLDYLHEKELLLLLDNFEHLLEGTDFLVEILKKSPKVKLLITSRERLNLSWEWCYELGGLRIPAEQTEYIPEEYSAVQLFQQAAGRVRKRFALSAGDKPAVTQICQLVEGMPLGIELAAAWVGTHSCEEIAREVSQNISFLQISLQDIPTRHQSLRATFEHSWNLLSPSEKQCFVKLSTFQRGFQHAAAEKVTGASRFVLKSLVDKSLLRFVPPGRYEIHELLRQYAAERLAKAPELLTAVRDQHCRYYTTFLQNWAANLNGPGAVEAQAAIKTEIENVRSAWGWAVTQNRVQEIQRGLDSLARYYLLAGPFQEGAMLILRTVKGMRNRMNQLDEPTPEDQNLLSRLLIEQAKFLNISADFNQAIATIKEAIELAQGNQKVDLEAAGFLQWGHTLIKQGHYDEARHKLEQALTLSRSSSQVEVDTLRDLGIAYFNQGRYRKAKTYYEQALTIYCAIGDKQGEAGVLRSLGVVAWFQGNISQASAFLEQALAIFQKLGDQHGMALQLHNLGRIRLEQGSYPQARNYFDQALHIFRQIGDRQNASWALLNLGRVNLYQGDYDRAADICNQALDIFRQIHARQGEGLALINLGGIACQQGSYSTAKGFLDQALLICREIGDRQSESWAISYLGELSTACGDYDRAKAYQEQTLKICREIGDRAGEGWGLANLALLSHQLGDGGAALELSRQAVQIGQELHHQQLQAAAFTHLGHAQFALRNNREAAAAYQEAITLHRQLGQPHLAMEGVAGLARVVLAEGRLAKAVARVEEILSFLKIEEKDPSPYSINRLNGTNEPFQIFLTCYRVLAAAGYNQRAQKIIGTANNLLQDRSTNFTDAKEQRLFLENVTVHREIMAAASPSSSEGH
ncbi:MAG: tetratricopeptide repeat protein [Ardenticatenaceae bacterium]|nr:tetratricopeptide repeat protein [Ardenticatenaceae bacterium]